MQLEVPLYVSTRWPRIMGCIDLYINVSVMHIVVVLTFTGHQKISDKLWRNEMAIHVIRFIVRLVLRFENV